MGNAFLGGNGVDAPRFDVNAFDWPLNTAKHPAQTPRFGSVAVNTLKGNGINNWDVSILRNMLIGDRYRVEFRFEMFNAWNHPSFGNPVTGPTSPNFGRTFSTQVDPRDVQFGLKFHW